MSSLPFLRLWCVCLSALVMTSHPLRAVTLTGPPEVAATRDSATVRWRTDVECGSRLNYGTAPDALKQRADGKVSADHTVTIGSLEPGTKYYFAAGSSRQWLATGSFTTGTTDVTSLPDAKAAPQPGGSPAQSVPAKQGLLPKILSKFGGGGNGAAKPAAPVPLKAPPSRLTWGNPASLLDHYERHGADFRAKSADDYAAQAWFFREQGRAAGWPMKMDTDGTVRIWDGRTGSFAAYNSDGTTKTFFKPGSAGYWERQPGRQIKPAQLPFK
ncbi:MAG: fibronectin type III domain-containing protein [Verrucomicrobiaceae bacterium]|nr:fibronectin type III domain-containing protein [Verrucomicrobiaceae bacterium]